MRQLVFTVKYNQSKSNHESENIYLFLDFSWLNTLHFYVKLIFKNVVSQPPYLWLHADPPDPPDHPHGVCAAAQNRRGQEPAALTLTYKEGQEVYNC